MPGTFSAKQERLSYITFLSMRRNYIFEPTGTVSIDDRHVLLGGGGDHIKSFTEKQKRLCYITFMTMSRNYIFEPCGVVTKPDRRVLTGSGGDHTARPHENSGEITNETRFSFGHFGF
jgi:hypothetical protein